MILNNWLFIEPFVHISLKEEKVLLYNTLNGKALEYSSNRMIYKIIKEISLDENLLIINLTQAELAQFEIKNFVCKIKKNFMGDLITNSFAQKPIQIKPIFNIQRDVESLRRSKEISIGTKIMQSVIEITIYINENCNLNCKICENSFKQFSFCSKRKEIGKDLDILYVQKILDELSGNFLQKININGGNIFKHAKFEELIELLEKRNEVVEFYIHYKNILENISSLHLLSSKMRLNILSDSSMETNALAFIEQYISNNLNVKYCYTFVVQNSFDVINVEKIISDYSIENYIIRPYYSTKNNTFFRKNIFVNKKDIFDAKPTITDIYNNKVINSIHFGRLNIMNDGSVFANLNEKVLGNIKTNTLHKIVYKEMNAGKSWRQTRDNVKPCKNCLYKHICPPISNYEYNIGRFNLCTIVN